MGDGDGAARHRSILRAKEPCRVMTQHNKKLQFEEVSNFHPKLGGTTFTYLILLDSNLLKPKVK